LKIIEAMDDVGSTFLTEGGGGSERVVGQVADYCPTCGVVRPFQVAATVKCMECGDPIIPGREGHKRMVVGEPLDLETLITVTHPDLPGKLAERLAREKKVQDKQNLTTDERQALLQVPFVELSGKAEAWKFDVGTPIFGATGLAFLFTLSVVTMKESRLAGFFFLIVLALGFFVSCWIAIDYIIGKVRNGREILATLGQLLKPLSPTQQELEDLLKQLDKEGHKEIAKLKPRKILESIEKAQAAGPRVKGS
jgi:hypothetical protein